MIEISFVITASVILTKPTINTIEEIGRYFLTATKATRVVQQFGNENKKINN